MTPGPPHLRVIGRGSSCPRALTAIVTELSKPDATGFGAVWWIVTSPKAPLATFLVALADSPSWQALRALVRDDAEFESAAAEVLDVAGNTYIAVAREGRRASTVAERKAETKSVVDLARKLRAALQSHHRFIGLPALALLPASVMHRLLQAMKLPPAEPSKARVALPAALTAPAADAIMRSMAGPLMVEVLAALESDAGAYLDTLSSDAPSRPRRWGAVRTAFMKPICAHLVEAFPGSGIASLERIATPIVAAAFPKAVDDYRDAVMEELKRARRRGARGARRT